MKRTLIAIAMALAIVAQIGAEQWRYVANVPDITVAATAIGITDSYINGAGHVQANVGGCIVSTAQIRYTVDGTPPTTTYGYVADAGAQIPLQGNDVLSNFRAIRTTSTSGVISCIVAAQ